MTDILLIRITANRFVYTYMPPEMRTKKRILLHTVLVSPFKLMMDEYIARRNKLYIKARVANEKICIEWYLNYLFDPDLQRIYIQNRSISGVSMGIRGTEPAKFETMGIRGTEPLKFISFPERGVDPDFGKYRFAVYIPNDLEPQKDAIAFEVNCFRQAGRTFVIKINP